MSLWCSLWGHRYGDPVTDERTEEANGRTAIAEIRRKTCKQCGLTEEKRLRTRIVDENESESRPSDDSSHSTPSSSSPTPEAAESETGVTDEPSTSPESVDTPSTNPSSSADKTNRPGDGNPAAAARDDNADGGVFLKSNSETNSTENTGFDNPSDGLLGEKEQKSDDDEGVVMLKGELGPDTPTQEYTVSCESCEFEQVEQGTARRDGDLCPTCGGWLEVIEFED